MATGVQQGRETHYKCDVRGLAYREEAIARDGEDWCRTHDGSCSLEYPQHAAELEEVDTQDNKKA